MPVSEGLEVVDPGISVAPGVAISEVPVPVAELVVPVSGEDSVVLPGLFSLVRRVQLVKAVDNAATQIIDESR